MPTYLHQHEQNRSFVIVAKLMGSRSLALLVAILVIENIDLTAYFLRD